MTMQQPRVVGPQPSAHKIANPDWDCTIAIQALCHGELDSAVRAVAGAAARPGREHIAVRFGRVLLYLEDRAALDSLAGAVRQALRMADTVFGPVEDAFTAAERADRRRFERGPRR